MTTTILVCLDYARQHVELLTGSADTPCCFRMVHDSDKRERARNLTGRLIDLWWQIEGMQRDGRGGFIVVNEGGHRGALIRRIRALFVDCDGAPMPKDWHVRPSFVTRRDEVHWHAYWVLSDNLPPAEFDVAQRRLAAQYGTDPKVHDLPRVMRLAGTLHLKDPSRPLLVKIRADNPRRTYTAAAVLDGMPEPAPKTRTAGKSAGIPTGEPVSAEIVRAMLAVLDPDCDYEEWRNIGAAVRAAPIPGDDDEALRFELFDTWSQGAPGSYDEAAAVVVFDSLPPDNADPKKIHFGSLVAKARAAGYTGPISIKEVEAHALWQRITEEYAMAGYDDDAYWERLSEGGAFRRAPPRDPNEQIPAEIAAEWMRIREQEERAFAEVARKKGWTA